MTDVLSEMLSSGSKRFREECKHEHIDKSVLIKKNTSLIQLYSTYKSFEVFCLHLPFRLLQDIPSSVSLSELSCFSAANRLSFSFFCKITGFFFCQQQNGKKMKLSCQKNLFITFSSMSGSHTLEILSLLHWATPLLTLTIQLTARFRAC